MKSNQIKWAKAHNWFNCTTKDGQGVIVQDVSYSIHTEKTTVEYREFRNFTALRDWAGY